ncbi:hypothetical protein [Candidatus Accumulibacter vicinus]
MIVGTRIPVRILFRVSRGRRQPRGLFSKSSRP